MLEKSSKFGKQIKSWCFPLCSWQILVEQYLTLYDHRYSGGRALNIA
jgi:hypothetical protein